MNAVITSARLATTGPFSGFYLYGWKQQIPSQLDATFDDPASGWVGTVTSDTVFNSPAFEINNTSVLVGTEVIVEQRGYVQGQLCFEFQASGVTGTGIFKHVPRWNSAGDGLEETAVTIGSAGFSTVDSAVFIPYPASSIVSTTPFILLDPEVGFYGTTSQVSQLRINLATNGIGTGIRVLAESDYPFTSSSFLLNSVESCWSMSLSGDSAHGHANFSAGTSASASNVLSTNVLMLTPGHNDTSNPVLPAIGGFYLSVNSGSGTVDRNFDFHANPGSGGVAAIRLNGVGLASSTGITAGSLSP